MNRFIYFLLVVLLSLSAFFFSAIFGYSFTGKQLDIAETAEEVEEEVKEEASIVEPTVNQYTSTTDSRFFVVQDGTEIEGYDTFSEAKTLAEGLVDSKVYNKNIVVWSKNGNFQCYANDEKTYLFENYIDAYNYAKDLPDSSIYDRRSYVEVFDSDKKEPDLSYMISSIPFVTSAPEYVKGSEIANISAIVKSLGEVGIKTKLYDEIAKDTTPFTAYDTYNLFGNPNVGLVGDITTAEGYGTFDKPLYDLLLSYFPTKALNITGVDFTNVEKFVSSGSPVLVITNDTFREIMPVDLISWNTPEGEIIHTASNYISVLVIGYDETFVYVNNPITNEENQAIPKEDFIKAWEQMGRMAITYVR